MLGSKKWIEEFAHQVGLELSSQGIEGLGFLPGLCCPHHDRVQSNGVLRAEDFEKLLRRHPQERGICTFEVLRDVTGIRNSDTMDTVVSSLLQPF